ncbi:hepcidin-1 [Chanos chanos]|uniref:Hepcidin-1 n=1 Tax=Chanos chanos TaxID=29144 RepID=A0A6J2W091_CHACN|nr:hepcidin [Chanos chanos]
MKYISVCVAATVIIACLCILETSAVPLSETQSGEPSNNEALPEMELTERSMERPVYFRAKRHSHLSLCRYCCNCCRNKGCGFCCKF